jgi:hypothetical protein
MKHRRLWISLLTVFALLTQGAASAWIASSMVNPPPAQTSDESLPCHGGTQGQEPSPAQQDVTLDCCDGDCSCAGLCAGHATLPAFGAGLMPLSEPLLGIAAASPAVHAAFSLTPLRPPIVSHV